MEWKKQIRQINHTIEETIRQSHKRRRGCMR